jgi:hypothetical protein
MATPKLPWYNKLRETVAPTEPITNFFLILVIAISIVILIKGDAAMKALWVVYLVSP